MVSKLALVIASLGAAVVAASCGSAAYGSSAAASPGGRYPGAVSTPGSSGPSATVGVRSTTVGQILVDGSGRPLYLFEADKGTTSSCYDSCAGVWPPLTAAGAPTAGAGVNQSLLSTTTRKDGTTEVVYNGHPLYHFVSA